MDIDTTLAQDYLKKDHFLNIEQTNEAIYFDGMDLLTSFDYTLDQEYPEISRNLQHLALLLKENQNLFAQLEYLNREIPIEDTKAQLNLIIQQLYYLSSCNVNNIPKTSTTDVIRMLNYSHFPMSRETPLLHLGFVVRACVYLIDIHSIPSIAASKETAEVCYLFTTLCNDAGLAVVTEFGGNAMEHHAGKEALGAIGVISECSDVDSAVDVFLKSSKEVPWRLRRILVQENVYKQFKDALTWKCNLNITGKGKNTQSTSDILHFNNRVFLIDALDITDPKPSEVIVEAYRTRKELLSFLNKYRPHYVSLWANDIAEINEVAHSIPSQVVWVNNFADFRGPPKISDAIYSARSLYLNCYEHLSETEIFEVLELQKSWLKLDSHVRYEVLSEKLDDISSSNNFYSDIRNYLRRAQLYSCGTFVDVGKDYVCQGVPVPSDMIHLCLTSTNFINEAFFRSLIRGNAFIFKSVTPEISLLIKSLKKAGLPVSAESWQSDSGPKNYKYTSCHLCNTIFDFDQGTRVIWTNSGTIFAN
ncbi:unnamed protein product [Arctia plantaginis]|uniref:Uncharacterized protein n=1 Tax=Arctia plantaginis TaxID=874455 RepID=A0A8S1AWT1_ARCPL|nr:unnamed protein product [Arctia plantaginis]